MIDRKHEVSIKRQAELVGISRGSECNQPRPVSAAEDWASRKVMASKIAITLEACHAVDVLQEAFHRYGTPEIVNTDQGSQFTAIEFVTA